MVSSAVKSTVLRLTPHCAREADDEQRIRAEREEENAMRCPSTARLRLAFNSSKSHRGVAPGPSVGVLEPTAHGLDQAQKVPSRPEAG